MVTVLLYGFLGRQFGRVHRYDVRSPSEAVRALCATVKGFRQALIDGSHYRVVVGGREALTLQRIGDPVSERETIRIVPTVSGAGGGFGQVLLGAALIVGAPWLGALAPASMWGAATSAIGAIGWSMALGGVSQMLFSPPKAESGGIDRPENKPSYAFDGAVNTAAQGNPVPVCYGRLIIGSQVISAGFSVEQIVVMNGPLFGISGFLPGKG